MGEIVMGQMYKDKVTRFTGICIGKADYITGCKQVLIAPRCKDILEMPDSHWIDEQRLELVNLHRIVIEDSIEEIKGCDKPAPKR